MVDRSVDEVGYDEAVHEAYSHDVSSSVSGKVNDCKKEPKNRSVKSQKIIAVGRADYVFIN